MAKSRAEWFREYRAKNAEKFRAYWNGRYQKKHSSAPRPKHFSRKKLGKEEYHRLYYDAKGKQAQRQKYDALQNKFFEMYGNICVCCKESRMAFLTVEHKNGLQGNTRKRGSTLYKELTKEYRPDLYEVLCMNCNHARMRLGYCPHERE
jgi:hypothetical protein